MPVIHEEHEETRKIADVACVLVRTALASRGWDEGLVCASTHPTSLHKSNATYYSTVWGMLKEVQGGGRGAVLNELAKIKSLIRAGAI